MKKYQVIFNSEMKTFGFYVANENMNYIGNNIKNHNKGIIMIAAIISVFLISILLWNKYKKIFFNHKRVFVKELEMINKKENLI